MELLADEPTRAVSARGPACCWSDREVRELETAAVIEYYARIRVTDAIALLPKKSFKKLRHGMSPFRILFVVIRVAFCHSCHKTQRTLFAALADSFLEEV